MRAKRGFTLVEMLTVLVIVSVLMGLISAALSSARAKGHKVKVQTFISQLSIAINSYELNFGDYPPGNGDLASSEQLYAALSSPRFPARVSFKESELGDTNNNKKPEIIDFWGNPIFYSHHRTYNGEPRAGSYRLISAGPDGEFSTSDDVTNFQ